MLNDFSALDLLSVEGAGFPRSLEKARKISKKMKARKGAQPMVGFSAQSASQTKGRNKVDASGHKLSAFLPLIGRKLHLPVAGSRLQGWPVTLSWPTKEIRDVDLWADPNDRSDA